jgi:ribosomal protein S12 methylthiotransferase accessory factor YcaO
MKNMHHFNIPQKKFITDNVYTSFSKIGNYLRDGYLGPDGSTAIDTNKKSSINKAFSEAIERRAIRAGGIPSSTDKVYAINLIRNKVVEINSIYSSYLLDKDYPIDTTGSAAHTSSEIVIYNSLKELMEKNGLLLFWYGLHGKKLIIEDEEYLENNKIVKSLSINGKECLFFINDFFFPLKIVITIIVNNTFICSSGVGSSFTLEEAIEKSIQEAFLLLWKDETIELVDSRNRVFIKRYENHSLQLEHLNRITEKISISKMSNEARGSSKTEDLLKTLPEWVNNVYVIPLKQYVRPKLKCVKVFSPEMFNHIPLKEYINLNNPMNLNVLGLTSEQLSLIPDCLVL